MPYITVQEYEIYSQPWNTLGRSFAFPDINHDRVSLWEIGIEIGEIEIEIVEIDRSFAFPTTKHDVVSLWKIEIEMDIWESEIEIGVIEGEAGAQFAFNFVSPHRQKHLNSPHRVCRSIDLNIWEYLGGCSKRLEKHHALIVLEIQQILNGGGKVSLHMNWASLQQAALQMVYSRSMVKEQPGYEHWAMAEYIEEFGDLATNGMQSKGHRYWVLDSVPGVLIQTNR